MDLQVGRLITAPFLPVPAEVKKFEPRSGYYLLEVVLQDDHHTYKPLRITDSQLAQVEILERSPLPLTGNAEDFFFPIEAHRIRLAYHFDPQLAISVSQVDPLPHQVEAVCHYVLNSPRIRFLIADDPVAGKTIMAGLVLKELEYRRLLRRVLIVAPGHLNYQWQREMNECFQEPFAIIDRAYMQSAWGENIWEGRDRCITSIDFIKQVAIRHERDEGWYPENVSGENHGFDIRSTRYNPDGTFADIRYIEVKARACSGAICLSANEWEKARHFGEKFWIYIITEASTDTPYLHRMENPASRFQVDDDIFAAGFIIPEERWREKTGS